MQVIVVILRSRIGKSEVGELSLQGIVLLELHLLGVVAHLVNVRNHMSWLGLMVVNATVEITAISCCVNSRSVHEREWVLLRGVSCG